MYKLSLGNHRNVYTKKYANKNKRIKAREAHKSRALINKGNRILHQKLA